MKKFIIALMTLFIASSVSAQNLPKNPWRPSEPTPKAQAIEDDGLPVNPWDKKREIPRASQPKIKSWVGSGQHGRLAYEGESSSWTNPLSASEERIAPEVSTYNMLSITQHLRNLGYKIPSSYDSGITNAPKKYEQMLKSKYSEIFSNKDPMSKGVTRMMRNTERGTGLDFNNILFNTTSLINR